MTTARCDRFWCVGPPVHAGRHRKLGTAVRDATPRILEVFGRLGMTEATAAELARTALECPEALDDALAAAFAALAPGEAR